MRWLLSYKEPTTEIERTTLRIKADSSGNIYLPLGWYSTDWNQNCPYSWKVSIDAGNDTNYSGTGSASGSIRVGYWLKPWSVHTVTIKPQTETYGWCRALGFKWSSYAQYLINIISDKSYMWYWVSDEDTGNYFKYYQYNWCTNLLDTDNEVLPDTVHFIGDNYRAYEYTGCTNLKVNAQEKIFKQVRKIWTNYRAYQYQNCAKLWTVMMRAINWCSIWSGFRNNMFSWAGSSTPMNITIEGGIVEGGSWWLTDANVNSIKVYTWLVADYKTKLSWITATKITNNPEWDTNNYEYLEFKIKADSNWDIKIPVAWYSTTWTQDCAYDWMVSVDGADTVEYTWTGSTTPITVWTWEAWSEHRIIIYPKVVDWWWGRAFWFYNTWIETLLTEFIHDSFKCFATSYTATWDYFRYSTFRGCTALTSIYERLPSSVTAIGNYFHWYDYYGCTTLVNIQHEVVPYISSMWTYYRQYMFYNCSSIQNHYWLLAKPSSISSYPTGYRENMFGNAGNNLILWMWWYEALTSGLTNSMWLTNSHVSVIHWLDFMNILSVQDNSNWSNVSTDKFYVESYPYDAWPTLMLDGWLQLEWTKTLSWDSQVYYSDNYWGIYISPSNVSLWISDDEQYIYFPATYDRYWYRWCWMIWQPLSQLWQHLSKDWWEWNWYTYTSSPRGSRHDCYPKWISLYTSWNKNFWIGWDWSSYTNWWYWYIYQYTMNWYKPSLSWSNQWTPFYYPDSNNSLTCFLWVDRLWYNLLANERGITLYKYKWWADTSLWSEIWTHVEYSDDGRYCYILKGTTITQYKMSKLLDFSTRVSTWKTFSIPSWCWGFTIKKWHLYCNNWATVYKYSIPNT